MAKLSDAQRRANLNWAEKNPSRTQFINYRSAFLTFIHPTSKNKSDVMAENDDEYVATLVKGRKEISDRLLNMDRESPEALSEFVINSLDQLKADDLKKVQERLSELSRDNGYFE